MLLLFSIIFATLAVMLTCLEENKNNNIYFFNCLSFTHFLPHVRLQGASRYTIQLSSKKSW